MPQRYYVITGCCHEHTRGPARETQARQQQDNTSGQMEDDMSMDMSMSMSTTFEFTCDVGPLLFSWWNITSCTSFFLSCIPVILLGAARHWAFSYVAGGKKSSKGCASSQSRTTALLDGNGFRSNGDLTVWVPVSSRSLVPKCFDL